MTWDPFKDEGATLIEDAPEWDPFRDEGAKRLDADPAKVIDVDPSAFKEREGYGEPEKVSVADWLEKNHGVKFEDGVRDYEGKAKAFGLSGDAKGDFETLKHRESTLAARRKSSLGYVPGGMGMSGFSTSGLASEARSAKRYAGNLARNTPAVISKALWDAGAGTVDLGAFLVDFAMMGDPRGAPPEIRRIVEKPTAFMREIADYTGKAYGVDEDFESTITGMLMQGAGTVAAGVGTRGYSIRGQLFTEGLRDSEAERGKKFAEFTDEEKDLSLFKGMVYSVVGGRFEKLGLKGIAPKWFKSEATIPKSRIVRMLRAGATESGTEGAQNVFLNVLGAAIEGDREIFTGQRFKDLALDMALGFFLGSGANVTMEAGGAAVERMDRKGAIERTIDKNIQGIDRTNARLRPVGAEINEVGRFGRVEGQMPYREDGFFNPAYKPMPLFNPDGSWNMPLVDASREMAKARKEEEGLAETEGEQADAVRDRVAKAEQVYEGLLDEAGNRDMGEAAWNIRRYNAKLAAGLNPMDGATPTDWKFIDEFYSDEEVGAHVVQATGSESLVPMALQAKHGDQESQEEFVNRTLVPADSEVLVEAEVTPEEAEAMREVEASQSEDFYRKLYPELFETESPQAVQAEAMRDMINFVSERQLEGSTIEQVDEIRSFEQDLNDLRDQGVPEAEIERLAFNRIKAAGYDPTDPNNTPDKMSLAGRNIHDFRRGVWRDVSKLFRGADPMTVVEETSEGFLKRMIAEGEFTYQDVAAWRETMGDKGGGTEAELIEWVSEQSKAWMVGKSSLLEREQQMPSAFRRFLAQMFENFRHLFRRASQLKGMDRRGELDPEFKAFLERSNGTDENFLRDRLERPAQMESASDIEIDLLDAVPLSRLPRPDMEPEYKGELEQIFEGFGKNWKSYPKTAITLDEVAKQLREEGFEVQTPADVIDAYMAVSRGERVVNATNFTDTPSYSMGRVEEQISELERWIKIEASKFNSGVNVKSDNSIKRVSEIIRNGDAPFDFEIMARALGVARDAETGEQIGPDSDAWPRTTHLLNFLEYQDQMRLSNYFTDSPSYSMRRMLDSAQLEGYLNYHEINGVRASEASADLQKTYSISKTDARQYTLPLEDAERGSGDVVRNENTVEKQADVVGLAQEAFKSNTPEAWSKALEAGGGKVSGIIENLVKNPEAGWDVTGALVESPADAAALGRMLRSPYAESVKMLFIGEDGIVKHSAVTSVGSMTNALVHQTMVSLELRKISSADKQKLKGFVVLHNHPSGNPDPSRADIQITRMLRETSESIGIPLLDHVITNGKKYYSFSENGLVDFEINKGKATGKTRKSGREKLELLGVPEGEMAAWEAVDVDTRIAFNSPEQINRFRKKLGEGDFLLFLDRKNKLAGVEQIELSGNLTKENSLQILEGSARHGSTAFAVVMSGEVTGERRLQNKGFRETSKLLGVEYLDGITEGGSDGADFYSFNNSGLSEDQATYSMGRMDADYLKAVEAGDMETAQRIMDEAAKAARYNGPWFHGGQLVSSGETVAWTEGEGFFLARNENVAENYGDVAPFYFKQENFFDPTNSDHLNQPWVKEWIDFWREDDGWVDRRSGETMSDSDVLNMIERVELYEYEGMPRSERWVDFLKNVREYHDGFRGYDPTDSSWIAVVFSPSQIKSADPVTRDESGNVIPLSQRFDPNDARITYSMRPMSEAEYLAAVEAGDMAKAQRLVDEAAKAAGYNVGPVWHGTPTARPQSVNEIVQQAKSGLTTSDFPFTVFSKQHKTEPGIFLHDSKAHASLYAKSVGAVGRFFVAPPVRTRALAEGLEYIVTDPSQIKSADPATYDADGNVIPLSERFNADDARITYSMRRISDLGGDPNEMTTARERTPEERVLAQKVREFRTDEWLTQAQKNRIGKTPADGRAKLRAEFEKDFKRELKVLQTKAVESRKRQRLRESGERKIAKVEARRLEQIKTLHDQGEDVTAKLEELDRIKKGLPTAVRHRLGGEVQVSRRKTRMGRQNEVNRRLVRARELAEGHEATRRKAWLRRTLKRYGTQSGPKLQNLSKEVTKDIRDRLRVALYAAHQDRPEETIERMAKPEGMDQQTFEDTARDFVGLLQPHNRDYGRIEAAYFAVQDLIREGKYSMDQFRDQRKARLDELALTSTKQALQGNPLLNDSEIAQQEEASGAKGKAGRWLSNAMSGYVDGFENIIRRIDGEQEGPIWRELYADPVDGIAASQDRVNIYVADAADMLLDGMATAFPDLVTKKGEPDVSAITKRLTEWERHPGKGERTGIEMSDREGGAVVDRPLSIAEAITVKLLLRQEGSHPTFRIQHGVEDIAAFEKAVDAYIGPDALAFVEHVISPFYDGAFNQLNEVHKRVEGYEMDPVKDYFPFLREIESADMEDAGNPFAPFEESGSPDGVEKGSLKTRSEMVTLPFRFQSVTSVLQNSVRTNANYIGKAGLEKKFRRLTTDPNFKRALKQRFGGDAVGNFVDAANVFTAGRMKRGRFGTVLDAARSRMITGVLAAKPKIMFTQLTSIPAGAVDMPVTEWVGGVAQIMRSPEKHFRELLATPQMKHRITQAQAQETITSLNKLQNLGLGAGWGARMEQAIKYSMILIKVGDVAGASLSAGPVYFRAKERELKAGKSEAQAKQIAAHEFAMAVNRSQQSPHLHSRPQTYQQSEFLRALYAFRSAPIQYQSEVNRAISEFVRTSLDSNQSKAKRWEVVKQSGKAFFVYHILLPQLFYALNNALTGFWLDDDERVLDYWKGSLLTLLMGNFSAIPVAGDTIYSGAAKLTDTSSFSPTVAPIGAEQIARIPGWMDHLISGTSEQRVRAASRMANFTGLPAETIVKQAQSFSELMEDDDPTKFLELMGWSEFIFGNQ